MKRYHVTEEYGLQINATENRPSSHLLSFPRHPSQDINFVRQTIYSSLRIKYIRKVNTVLFISSSIILRLSVQLHMSPPSTYKLVMDLQLRALDSVITRKLDNLIDPFVRWNIKLVLLAQLATILISPSISFSLRVAMQK